MTYSPVCSSHLPFSPLLTFCVTCSSTLQTRSSLAMPFCHPFVAPGPQGKPWPWCYPRMSPQTLLCPACALSIVKRGPPLQPQNHFVSCQRTGDWASTPGPVATPALNPNNLYLLLWGPDPGDRVRPCCLILAGTLRLFCVLLVQMMRAPRGSSGS